MSNKIAGILGIILILGAVGYWYYVTYGVPLPSSGINLAIIPDDWGNYNPSSWSGYGSDPQIVFLDTSVERTSGHPSIRIEPHTSADMNGARECDGRWYNVVAGDHIVFKCWMKTSLSSHPAYNNDPTDSYGVGARIGIDFIALNPYRIVAGALINGVGYDDISIVGHYSSIGSDVSCNTPTWTQQVIDCIVPSDFSIAQMVGWIQTRPEQGDTVQGWFTDAELYINP